jgi:hypothetical protein
MVMAGAELVEWYQIHPTHGFHGFHVFDAIPFTPFQTLLWSVLPSAASTGLPISMLPFDWDTGCVMCFGHENIAH